MTAVPVHADAPTAGPSAGVTPADVARGRRRRTRHRRTVVTVLAVLVVVLFCVSLVVGRTVYPPADVLRVVLGQDVDGASFTVGTLRLPRAALAVLTGLAFGLGGVTFQTMLRNPLASPDVIGITSAASAAATFGIVTLGLGATGVSTFAIAGGLAVALVIYALAAGRTSATTRLVLVGIGVAAMLDSVTTYLLSEAAVWDQQAASRWLTGSLNGASWEQAWPLALALAVLAPVLLLLQRDLAAGQLGDDTASALGVRVGRTRLLLLVAAVGLVAFGTAAAGPIAFVAFLSGPIAARLVGPGTPVLVPAALVGAVLVLTADLVGQNLLGTRMPVGVVTGVLGAPYLVHLVVRTHRTGGSL